jgi:hypothetical protein
MFCHHHDEAEVYGDEPAPCPFCGLGGAREPAVGEEHEAPGFEDSNEALRHALFDTKTGDDLRVHW